MVVPTDVRKVCLLLIQKAQLPGRIPNVSITTAPLAPIVVILY
jgi:hypothetical protein